MRARLIIYLLLLVLSAVFLLPLVWMLSTSLKPIDETMSLPPRWMPGQMQWQNYPRALPSMGGFWTFLGSTLFVCTLGVVGAVLSNVVVAYGFARLRWRGREALFAVTLATMMVPFPVLMVPLYGVFKTFGWIGTLKPLWVPAFFGGAFNIFLMRQFFRTIPEELSEAARLDGCNEWAIFWRMILPLSKPVLAVVALFYFLWAWNDFMGPMLYLTRKHTFTLAI